MQKTNNPLVLRHDDYKLLNAYLNGSLGKTTFDRKNAADLKEELKKASIVQDDEFPKDVVRINSFVKIKMEGRADLMDLQLVTPDDADIKEKKISIMSPMGTALIGCREGQQIKWRVPYGQRNITILEVLNPKAKKVK